MKTKLNLKNVKGMTLIELTVVILVLLSLISVLFIGAKAWKDGADRANCVVYIGQYQKGVRSWANMKEIEDAATINTGEITDYVGTIRVKCKSADAPDYDYETEYHTAPGAPLFASCTATTGGAHVPTGDVASW